MRLLRRLFRLGTYMVLLLVLAAGLLVWRGMTEHLGTADIALVLGNTVNPDGTPSPRLKARLDTAIAHYRAGRFPKIIVSGATGVEGVPEGTAMRDYLVLNGVPAGAVITDDEGVDTFASAQNAARVLKTAGGGSVFVISQYFHIPRCRLALAKCGITKVYDAHPAFFEARDIYSTFRELPALVKYWFRSDAAPAE